MPGNMDAFIALLGMISLFGFIAAYLSHKWDD